MPASSEGDSAAVKAGAKLLRKKVQAYEKSLKYDEVDDVEIGRRVKSITDFLEWASRGAVPGRATGARAALDEFGRQRARGHGRA